MVTKATHWVVRKTHTTRTRHRRVLSITTRSAAMTVRSVPYRFKVDACALGFSVAANDSALPKRSP